MLHPNSACTIGSSHCSRVLALLVVHTAFEVLSDHCIKRIVLGLFSGISHRALKFFFLGVTKHHLYLCILLTKEPGVLLLLLYLRRMQRYMVIKEVGNGTFGNVWQAVNKVTGEVVAIKKMKKKYYSWEECMNLQEVKSLRRMNHSNIVKLKEVIREHDVLYFIFEYMECNLYQLMKDRKNPFSEAEIRKWCFQIFQALAFIHQRGYFHRDLKPENLLLSGDVIKVADFGLAREIHSQPPFTEYVSTRWYRAPEVLLQSKIYGPAVDLWGMGAIMAELFTLHPLFPGTSEADEIYKICSVIGSPDRNCWADGLQLAEAIKFQFPLYPSIHLSLLIPSASEDAISLISSLCSWDPNRRPTAAKALQHAFFQPCFYIPPSLRHRTDRIPKNSPSGMKEALEQGSRGKYSVGVLCNSKPAANMSSTINASLRTGGGAQRNLEMQQYQDHDLSGRSVLKIPVKPLYQQPGRNNPGYNHGRSPYRAWNENEVKKSTVGLCGVSQVVEKVANLTLSPHPQPMRQRPPPSMRAGGQHPHTEHLNRSYEIPAARNCMRRVVG